MHWSNGRQTDIDGESEPEHFKEAYRAVTVAG